MMWTLMWFSTGSGADDLAVCSERRSGGPSAAAGGAEGRRRCDDVLDLCVVCCGSLGRVCLSQIQCSELTAERHRLQEQLKLMSEQQQRASSSYQLSLTALQDQCTAAKVLQWPQDCLLSLLDAHSPAACPSAQSCRQTEALTLGCFPQDTRASFSAVLLTKHNYSSPSAPNKSWATETRGNASEFHAQGKRTHDFIH